MPTSDSSPTPRSASAARRARSRASSGTSCPTTASSSPGMSYDNTVAPRRVDLAARGVHRARAAAVEQDGGAFSWLFSSDVCKHCERAGCLEACPTGAIMRTEFDSVYVQPDICNGCGYCVVGCPFGVIDRREDDGRAWKCTLCYDRLKDDLEPACAKACPTDSILFGDLDELRGMRASSASRQLHERGVREAYLYGADAPSAAGHGGAERVLPAGRRARGLQPAARPGGAHEGRRQVVARGRRRRRVRSASPSARSADDYTTDHAEDS